MAHATLYFLDLVIDLAYINTTYQKQYNPYKGHPTLYNEGGLLYVEFLYGQAHARLLERMLTTNYKLYKRGYPLDHGKVVFFDASGTIVKTWQFKDAAIVNYKLTFNPEANGMLASMQISPAIQNYGYKIHRVWHDSPIAQTPYQTPVHESKPKEKDPFKIELKASNKDRANGVFGFDTLPEEKHVNANYKALKQSYNPLAQNILKKEYVPHWLSIRQGQTVTLELNWFKKKNAEAYQNIAFAPHPDFTITPQNLKEAKTVNITCNTNSSSPAQLLIKADNQLTVGALNVFYPKPKTITLEWCFVEIVGNETDKDLLDKQITLDNLNVALKKGLNPALINVKLSNASPTVVDISTHYLNFKAYKFIKQHPDLKIGSYIERSKKQTILNYIVNAHQSNPKGLTVYFIHHKCFKETDLTDKDTFKASGGISPTGTGVAFVTLDPNGNIDPKSTVHELMHALGLKHTFESMYKLKHGKTSNYMDYNNTKKHTYKWQWQNLHNYLKLK